MYKYSQVKKIQPSEMERMVGRTQRLVQQRRMGGGTMAEVRGEEKGESECIDENVYYDGDFYHQLLRELIERRTDTSAEDPLEMGRQWVQLQKLRTKQKKRVDTKASKGRKVRHDVHDKLVDFMVSQEWPRDTASHEARDDLFSSLFQ